MDLYAELVNLVGTPEKDLVDLERWLLARRAGSAGAAAGGLPCHG